MCENKNFRNFKMHFEDTKILEFNQYQNSDNLKSEHIMKIINFEKTKIIRLTNDEYKSYLN